MKTMSETHMDSRAVQIKVGEALLDGTLAWPAQPRGVVLFPHGRGTERDERNDYLAASLRKAGLGTFFVNLLTATEAELDARKAAFRFDVHLLAGRIAAATDWLAHEPDMLGMPVGYLGAGYGAAAALMAAARRPGLIRAVVSYDGLPNITEYSLADVAAPTLIIGGLEEASLERLGAKGKELMIVPGEAPGPEVIARLAAEWFIAHLSGPA